jgi:hypothetical protein
MTSGDKVRTGAKRSNAARKRLRRPKSDFFANSFTRAASVELRAERRFPGMVRPERFELPASSSGGKRSIQLSYGRVTSVYIESMASSIAGRAGMGFQTRKKTGTFEENFPKVPAGAFANSVTCLGHCPKQLQNRYQAVSSAVHEQTPWPLPNRIKNWHSVSRSLDSKVV